VVGQSFYNLDGVSGAYATSVFQKLPLAEERLAAIKAAVSEY